jgi:hypothetical protein
MAEKNLDEMIRRLRHVYYDLDWRQQGQLLQNLDRVIIEMTEREGGDSSVSIDCPCCGEPLTVTLHCEE